jgi:acyl-CoA synthetase (NDP forming)
MEKDVRFDSVFDPASVAVVGASEDPGKMGNWCVKSLLDAGYPGRIYAINRHSREVWGVPAYPSLREIAQSIDLGIIVVPAPQVAAALRGCADRGAKGAVIISSGFREAEHQEGAVLEKELVGIAGSSGMRLIGPNTFGLLHTHARLNATFTPPLCRLKKGTISMVGQSGGMCHLFMFAAIQDGVGLNKVVGLGNHCDVDFAELVDYLGADENTRAIALYIEGVEDPASLLEVTQHLTRRKPIVAMKGGRSAAIQKAAMAHTGAMAGRFELYQAALRQAGVITVDDPVELLDVSKALAVHGPIAGSRVAVLSIQAGPGIMMTDLCLGKGLQLAAFAPETLDALREPFPNTTIRTNPVDMGFALRPQIFRSLVRSVLLDPDVDAVLVGLIDPSTIFDDFFSESLVELAREKGKAIVVSHVTASKEAARRTWERWEGPGLLFFPDPIRTVNALTGMVRYGRILARREAQES